MIYFFKTTTSLQFLSLLILAVLLNLNLWVIPPTAIPAEGAAPLGRLVVQALQNYPMHGLWVLYVLGLCLQAWLIQILGNRFNLYKKTSILPAFCYLVLTGLINTYMFLSPAYFMVFVVIWLLFLIFGNLQTHLLAPAFDVGFAVGLGILIYAPALPLALFVFVALTIVRTFTWRVWMVALFGLLIPHFWVATWYFATDSLHLLLSHYGGELIATSPVPSLSYQNEVWIKLGLLTVLTLWTIALLRTEFLKMPVQTRRYFNVILYAVSFALYAFLVLPDAAWHPASLFLVPFSLFLAYLYTETSNLWYSESLNVLILAVLFYYQYVSFLPF